MKKVNIPSPIYEDKYGEVVPGKGRTGARPPLLITENKAVILSLFQIKMNVYFILCLFG